MTKKNIAISLCLILLLAGLPIFVFISTRTSRTHSEAAASTILYIDPPSTQSNPISLSTGQKVSLEIDINPGKNLATYVQLDLLYDQTKLKPYGSTPFNINTTAFPDTAIGPTFNKGEFKIALTIGGDPTKVIQEVTKIGTLTFQAIAPTTTGSIQVQFGNDSKVLSSAPTDSAGENVISSTIPAFVSITKSTVTPTLAVSPSPTIALSPTITTPISPSPTPTPSITVSPSPTIALSPSPTIIQGNSTTLTFSVLLDDIGHYGDNADPSQFSDSNQNPTHPMRTLDVFIADSSKNIIATDEGTMNYNNTNGNFTGSASFPSLAQGEYNVLIQTPGHLRRLIPGIQTLGPNASYAMPSVNLIAGDINGDNKLNILDYNLMLECFNSTSSCTSELNALDDLNDDGTVDIADLNILLREMSTQYGD